MQAVRTKNAQYEGADRNNDLSFIHRSYMYRRTS